MDINQYREEWKQPFTNKRYLHPPLAENMFTMWPDLKIICGDVIEKTSRYTSSGFRILIGEELVSPDFKAVEYHTRGDGAPIHSLQQNLGDYSISMESFCNIERIPSCFTEFTITNNTDHEITETIALLPRTGREDHLVGTEVDGYAHYDSNVANWGFIPSGWKLCDNLLTDGAYNILLQYTGRWQNEWQDDGIGLEWHKRHLLKLKFTVLPGEKAAFRCVFRHGEVKDFDYCAERKKAVRFWNTEIEKIRFYPGNGLYDELVNNLVAQCLQMFAYPVGKDYVLPRQGGLQRVIWPCEGVEFLTALDRIGDYYNYTEEAYTTYFYTLQCKSGVNEGAVQNLSGNFWGSMTGASCWGCACHILYRDSDEVFRKFRDPLYSAFGWMERQRAVTADGKHGAVGIFPPMQATDWPGIDQAVYTDSFNLIGYQKLAELFEHFDDPKADEIRAAYNDYFSCMKRAIDNEIAHSKRTEDEIFLTGNIGVEMTDPPAGAYGCDGPASLLRSGILECGTETVRLFENYCRNRGMIKNGLTGLMNDGLIFQGHNSDPWAGHTWYISYGDYFWFMSWLKNGETEKAAKTMFAQMKWGMSKEYYMLERYADNDPYWTPWMPNASANGRMLMMLADYFG